MNIRSDLAQFYNSEAKKYHQTRKKYRADGFLILKRLRSLHLKKPKLFELGCGGGRLISFLNHEGEIDFSYTGVDIAQSLLALAQKDNPKNRFICSDMLSALQTLKQESQNAILACASFQHLSTERERLLVMKSAYRALEYG